MNNSQHKIGFYELILQNKTYFFVTLVTILFVTFSFLYLFGLVPTELKTIVGREPVKESKGNRIGELPITIKIPSIGVDSQVYNPATSTIDVLNDFLFKGAVRYPGSGLLGGNGNIFIFGHSSSLKVVNNQAFKAFNGLRNLKLNDLIYVYSGQYEYTYKVTSVSMVSAEKAFVEFDSNSKILTLSTCSHFGEKTNRDVVESTFVEKKIIK